MPRVRYVYDGTNQTETTGNFSAGEETAQDAQDATNESTYKTNSKAVSRDIADNRRFIMEVI
jgi:hypothetical protein